MFSKELENLIQATLEDGVLEDYEKAALVKRAENEGVDLAELEIYINSLLQKRKREQHEKIEARAEQLEEQRREEFGRTCPNCGKQVPPLTVKCECGFEFSKKKRVSSAQVLYNKIEKIQSRSFWGEDAEKRKEQEILDVIKLFPIPNTKEDVIDFLALAAPNAKKKGGFFGSIINRIIIVLVPSIIFCALTFRAPKHNDDPIYALFICVPIVVVGAIVAMFFIDKETLRWNRFAQVWRSKFDQVIIKGRSLRGDPEFTQQLNYYENLFKK